MHVCASACIHIRVSVCRYVCLCDCVYNVYEFVGTQVSVHRQSWAGQGQVLETRPGDSFRISLVKSVCPYMYIPTRGKGQGRNDRSVLVGGVRHYLHNAKGLG